MCNKGLRKLLNCNSYISVGKTCRVDDGLYISCTLIIDVRQVIDIKQKKHTLLLSGIRANYLTKYHHILF